MIRDLIVQTPYRPGERLPPEREIAERLNVTRTVVREALIMLEIKGLVEVRRGERWLHLCFPPAGSGHRLLRQSHHHYSGRRVIRYRINGFYRRIAVLIDARWRCAYRAYR